MMDSKELEDAPCPLCCTKGDELILTGYDLLNNLPGKFTVVKCRACGLMRTSPRPTPEKMGFYYPDNYGPYKGTQVDNNREKENSFKTNILRIAKIIFDTRSTVIPKLRPGRMLEIGCASGSYLHYMAKNGWQVEGIEFSPIPAQSARDLGYAVETGALEKIIKPENRYDLIVGWMVLEHLHQPVESLRKMAKWACSNAMLVISVPNIGSFESRIFGRNWYALQVPTHLFHYDTESIVKTLRAGGWEVVRIHHHRSVSNLIASTGYWLNERGFSNLGKKLVMFPETGGHLALLILFPLALILSWFGQTGRMTVWAKRSC